MINASAVVCILINASAVVCILINASRVTNRSVGIDVRVRISRISGVCIGVLVNASAVVCISRCRSADVSIVIRVDIAVCRRSSVSGRVYIIVIIGICRRRSGHCVASRSGIYISCGVLRINREGHGKHGGEYIAFHLS